MRAFTGFDRVSTEEELSEVLDILTELERSGWLLDEDTSRPQPSDLWSDSTRSECADPESLAALLSKKPELKN